MPPKGKKSAVDKNKDIQDTEDPLQAVILADSFETRFHPFTLERPRCLLPLAGTPLIEYTLHFLAASGVEEVHVYCGAHTSQLEAYFASSPWTSTASPFKLELIRSTSRSIGDAMRDLDKRGILVNDFIVVYGDVVANLPLGQALAEHRARREKDKNCIMTMVLREAGSTRERTTAAPVFVVEEGKKRCLHYEQMSGRDGRRYVELEAEVLRGQGVGGEVEVRADLVDCGIDICTPDVLALWSDNFDYEAPRRGFLHSVLKDYELNGKTIHTHIADEHYTARVRDLQAYASVSRDVISRWAYPMAPDSNLYGDQSYKLYKQNIFREEGVRVGRTSKVGARSSIGRGTVLGEGSNISRSIIGRNCRIGVKCVIEDAYVWDNVTIEDGSEVRNAVLADGVKISKHSKIIDGALVSFDVQLPEGSVVENGKRITRSKRKDGSAEAAEGRVYEAAVDADGDSKVGLRGPMYQLQGQSQSTDSISSLDSDGEVSDTEARHHERSAGGSFVSVASEDSQAGPQSDGFYHDASSSIYDSLSKGHDVSTIQLELQGLRMSSNASEHQVRRAVVSALMRHVVETRKAGGASLESIVKKNRMLIERTVFDKEDDEKVDQVDFLLLTQHDLSKKAGGDGVLVAICNTLCMEDLIEVEALEQWWQDPRSQASEELIKVRGKTEALMTALANADSDEDEDEDGDEGGDVEEDEDSDSD